MEQTIWTNPIQKGTVEVKQLSIRIVITLSIALVGTVVFYGASQSLLNMVAEPFLEPRVRIISQNFVEGQCQPEYFLWIKTGEHRPVFADFSLSNDGVSAGRVTIVFTEDGGEVARNDFFVGAGQTETKTYQFSVNGSESHQYSLYIDGVSRA
jgi:hypothetical protein